ncbi:MAG: ArsR/SmtB family transcription factor [Peptostreptococcaceae bacterium]
MKELLVLRDLECIKAIAHPRRIDILKAFEKEPLSAKQLSQMLDEPHAKINYHIKTLYKVGILELVEEKIKSGIVEKYYYPTAKNIIVGKKVIDFSLDNLDDGEKKDICVSKFENMSELFYKAAEDEVLQPNNVIEYRDIVLNDSEIKEINEAIRNKIEEILSKKTEDEENKYSISLVSIPILEKEEYNL